MENRKKLYRWLIIIGFILVSSGPAFSGPMKSAPGTQEMALDFSGVQYLHRWSQNGQNEFTPQHQSDLSTWRDMVTINVHDSVGNAEQLADLANRALGFYQASGDVLHTDSKPKTPGRPAEHLAVALLGNDKLLEANFARFLLIDGTGISAVYSHRVYGDASQAVPAMEKWLAANGERVEKELMAWDKVPTAAALKTLPQSTTK